MKTKTIINELTQEDLVNLLCTATYGSMWLSCYAPDREGVEITESDCMEDEWAKCLLAGKKIACTDYYADEGEHYGTLEHYTEEDGQTTYLVSLQDIINGLQKCADGDYTESEEHGEWISKCLRELQNGGYNLDQPRAESLMQIILFGELIYG